MAVPEPITPMVLIVLAAAAAAQAVLAVAPEQLEQLVVLAAWHYSLVFQENCYGTQPAAAAAEYLVGLLWPALEEMVGGLELVAQLLLQIGEAAAVAVAVAVLHLENFLVGLEALVL
jgi:hypothetical protein